MKLEALLIHVKGMENEVGGYFEVNKHKDKFDFVVSSNGQTNVSTGREYVELPSGVHSLLWHYHPDKLGIWPSFEDLLISIPSKNKRFECYVNLIVTNLGCWVFDGICQSNEKKNIDLNQIYQTWYNFHLFMTKETQKKGGWDFEVIRFGIEQFRYEMFTNHGFRITFIDDNIFRNLRDKQFVSDVVNYLTYVLK